jgi:hypothetical protein
MAAAAAYPLESLGYSYSFPQFYGERLARAITSLFGSETDV